MFTTDEVTGVVDRFVTKLGERGIRFLGEQAFRLGARAARGMGQASRSLPLLGGAIGAVSDGMTTEKIGRRARASFGDAPTQRRGEDQLSILASFL